MEATSKCRRYRKGVLSPTNTTMHRCYACKNISSSCSLYHNVSSSNLGHDQKSREDCGICCPVKKIGTKWFKHGHLDSGNKNGNSVSRSSPSMALPSSLPSRYNKRAVLCGVSYTKRKFRLKGTINDIGNMRELLIKNFKFPIECIRVLTGILLKLLSDYHNCCLNLLSIDLDFTHKMLFRLYYIEIEGKFS